MGDFRQPFVFHHGKVVEIGSQAAGFIGAGEGGGNGPVYGHVLQGQRRFSALFPSPFGQGCVFLALVAAFYVPGGFSVTEKDDAYHRCSLMFTVNDFDIVDAVDIHEGRNQGRRDILVHSHHHDVGACFLAGAYLHAVDVDMFSAQY